MKVIFPKEIIENTVQVYLPKNNSTGTTIYGIVLGGLVLGLLSLPFIKVQLYSTVQGWIKPSKERTALTSMHPGKVLFSGLYPNTEVGLGDTLLILHSAQLEEQLAQQHYTFTRLEEQLSDLRHLVQGKVHLLKHLVSNPYKKAYLEYQEQLREHYTRIKKLKRDHERNQKLLAGGVIAPVAFEDQKLEYDLARNALQQYKKKQLSHWQTTLIELEDQQKGAVHQINALRETKKEYVITAPVCGTLLNLRQGIAKGSMIAAGALLAEISPDAEVLAECYISPMEIGLIDPAKPVKFQIDAYNYNQWGMATGNILEMGKDVEFIDNTTVYKVRCAIDQKYLQLNNGAKGQLIKGMSFTARFELAERTLFQLLYDTIDDWIHPGTL